MIIDPTAPQEPQKRTQGRTKAGLIVPTGAIQKTRRTLTKSLWKKWRRAATDLSELGINLVPFHTMPTKESESEPIECSGHFSVSAQTGQLECDCSVWHIEGVN